MSKDACKRSRIAEQSKSSTVPNLLDFLVVLFCIINLFLSLRGFEGQLPRLFERDRKLEEMAQREIQNRVFEGKN